MKYISLFLVAALALAQTPQSLLLISQGGGAPGLSGSVTTPSGTQVLSTLGGVDWAHWGLSSATSFDHSSTGGTQISNFTIVSAGTATQYTNHPFGFSWTGGTPTASATASTTGVYNNAGAVAAGFTFTAPAGTTQHILAVYVAVYNCTGKIVAHLSDSSASDYTDSTLTNSTSSQVPGLYTFTYRAGSASQTLAITWTMQTNIGAGPSVSLQAATLN